MTKDAPSDSVIRTWARLIRAAITALSAVERDLKTAGHPPLAWYDVLLELKRAGEPGLRPFEMEEKLLLAQHNVSRLLDRLERNSLIARRPADEDGRGQRIAITDTGLGLLDAMWPDYRAAIQRHVGDKLQDDYEAGVLYQLLGGLLDVDNALRRPGP